MFNKPYKYLNILPFTILLILDIIDSKYMFNIGYLITETQDSNYRSLIILINLPNVTFSKPFSINDISTFLNKQRPLVQISNYYFLNNQRNQWLHH